MHRLENYFLEKREEEDSKQLPKEQEWFLFFSGRLTKAQKSTMFERKLQASKLNSFLVSVFALTGTFISAYETQMYLEDNRNVTKRSKIYQNILYERSFIDYTAKKESSVNSALRLIVTLTTGITSSRS
jgi:hypothetical protein